MPAKLNTKKPITAPTKEYNEVLVTNVIAVTHYAKEGEGSPYSGNIEVGDIIAMDVNGVPLMEQKYVIHYIMLNDGVVIGEDSVILEGQDLIDAMVRNPNVKPEIKSSAYEILINKTILPTDAVIS